MTNKKEIYKCNICGNITEVVHSGMGELVCCGQPMELVAEKDNKEEGLEKHVPVIEKTEDGIIVKIGSVEHPMEENHFIEWIEIITENKIYKKFLKPEEKPEAEFKIKEEVLKLQAYCNVHGLWISK